MKTIPALQNSDYRRLLYGSAFHQQGMSGEQVLIGLLVYQTTGATSWVGIILALYFLPFFVFGLLSGAIADWIDRRTLLRRIEMVIAITLFGFAISLYFSDISILLIATFTFIAGSLRALHQPVRSSYAYDLVGKNNLVTALALLNLGSRAGQLIGALVAGFMMEEFGAPAALVALGIGHVIACVPFCLLKTGGIAAIHTRAPLGQNFKEFFFELISNRLLLILLGVTAAVEIFGFSFATALPEIAASRLEIGATGLGWLQGIRAFAGIVAGLIFAIYNVHNKTGVTYLIIILGFGIFLTLLSQTSLLALTISAIFLVSFCAASSDILSQSMMQLSVVNKLRGRAMGIWVLALGFGPVGHLELGAVSGYLGLQIGLLINGMALILLSAILGFFVPRLRRL